MSAVLVIVAVAVVLAAFIWYVTKGIRAQPRARSRSTDSGYYPPYPGQADSGNGDHGGDSDGGSDWGGSDSGGSSDSGSGSSDGGGGGGDGGGD
ncbi:MAG: hypothetical protein M3501_00665 [Actinomycetota bacterium]|nr:hypothetical protein [Actinomycetota bacterium]MDQ3350464.1 hypothetical protein [Actinomycetota bacterium]